MGADCSLVVGGAEPDVELDASVEDACQAADCGQRPWLDGGLPINDWGHLPFEFLDGLRQAMERDPENCVADGTVKAMRLVNRHWRRWASESISFLGPWGDLPVQELAHSIATSFTSVRELSLVHYSGSLKGQMAPLGALSQLTHLDMSTLVLTDKDLLHVGRLTGLTQLVVTGTRYMSHTEVTGEGWRYLGELNALRRLSVPRICDRGLRHLGWLTGLEYLHIGALCPGVSFKGWENLTRLSHLDVSMNERRRWEKVVVPITADAMRSLGNMMALEHLSFSRYAIDDRGLRCLGRQVTALVLDQCDFVTDAGLERVGNVTGLRSLSLSGCHHVTDVGLGHIGKCVSLCRLELRNLLNFDITDRGLAQVENLTALTSLTLGSFYRVSSEAQSKLRLSLPLL